jgi:acyl-CoA hydrolase
VAPILHTVDEVVFRAPVNIRDLVKIIARILYTVEVDGNRQMHVDAIAHITSPEKLLETISNVFHFTFKIPGLVPPLRTMLPETKDVARRMAERRAACGSVEDPSDCAAR